MDEKVYMSGGSKILAWLLIGLHIHHPCKVLRIWLFFQFTAEDVTRDVYSKASERQCILWQNSFFPLQYLTSNWMNNIEPINKQEKCVRKWNFLVVTWKYHRTVLQTKNQKNLELSWTYLNQIGEFGNEALPTGPVSDGHLVERREPLPVILHVRQVHGPGLPVGGATVKHLHKLRGEVS